MSIYIDITKQLDNFCLHVQLEAGDEIVGILGRSGSGKSITLMCIAGIITPDEGEIVVNDMVFFSSKKKINVSAQKRNTGLMFQNYALFPNMTVANNIGIAITTKSKTEKKQIVESYLELLQIMELADRYPGQLSGGQQQRVALARIMAKSPDVLMLDEPLSAIDVHLRFSIENDFARIMDSFSGTILYISHSIDEIYRFCDRTAIMSGGQIVEINRTEELFRRPATLEGARLSGCRNISRASILNERQILAIDWGITFDMPHSISREISYIGIREENISIGYGPEDGHSFPVMIEHVKQSPFSSIVIFKPRSEDNAPPISTLIGKISNDETSILLKNHMPHELYANIQRDNILLL